jgi:2-polyprenyl-3-methyl-5-hydroxy-6-metoxy-1,4-benzoquinol methylase
VSRPAERPCGICGASEWTRVYEGPIRDGVFGRERGGIVERCIACGVEYLASPDGLSDEAYGDDTYRRLVGEAPDAESFFASHDEELLRTIPLLPQESLRGRRIADVGCAGGSLLDVFRGIAKETIAVEPAAFYHDSLRARGHMVYGDLGAAVDDRAGSVDLVVCLSVIEHVREPVQLLADMRRLLAPGGTVVVSTPNRADLLLAVGCEPYRRFFYRVVHRYYFDAASLGRAARAAGFAACAVRFYQRFDFANFIGWLVEHRPCGRGAASPLGPSFDRAWRGALEDTGRSDYLFAYLQ